MSPSAEQAGTSNDTSGQAGVGMAKGENARLRIRDQPAVRVTWGLLFQPHGSTHESSGIMPLAPSSGYRVTVRNRRHATGRYCTCLGAGCQ
jgi:hypothetical protein